jgi:anti-sigma regulatory factor (Ser/Thr protein kinase)
MVALAVSEAVANTVRHAYPTDGPAGHVDVDVTHTPGSLIVTVEDRGAGIDIESHRPGLGIGIPIMQSQADRVEIDSDGNGTTVLLHFTIPERISSQPRE